MRKRSSWPKSTLRVCRLHGPAVLVIRAVELRAAALSFSTWSSALPRLCPENHRVRRVSYLPRDLPGPHLSHLRTTKQMPRTGGLTTESSPSPVPEAAESRFRCWRMWFLMRTPFRACRRLPSHRVLARDLWCLFLFDEDIGSMGLGLHPDDLI